MPKEFSNYKDKPILAPTNEETFSINEQILEGNSNVYYSQDNILEDKNRENYFAEVYTYLWNF